MTKIPWLTALLAASLLLVLLVFSDAMPLLRGPQPDSSVWHWPYQLRPFSRWWPVMLVGVLFLTIAFGWLRMPPPAPRWQTALWLGLLCCAVAALQLGLLYADRERPFVELVDRALAVQTNGYFWSAAAVTNIDQTLADYPNLMRQFESDHVRTHPPGLLLANWQTIQALQALPVLSRAIAPAVWEARCTDVWLLNQPPQVAAALGVWAVLPLLSGASAVLPAYLLVALLGSQQAARLAALLVALLPALLVFTPTPDQLSAALALWLVWLAVTAQRAMRHRLLLFCAAGLLLSLLTFISLGNAALLLILLALWLLPKPATFWLREAAVFGLGTAAIWVVYWAGWGVPPWVIAFAGLAEHEALVIAQRRYAIWTLFNLVDVLIFAGLPVLAGFIAFVASHRPQMSKPIRVSLPKNTLRLLTPTSGRLAVATAVLIVLLTLSGSTRGEVGRIWLFLFPLLALFAALFFAQRLSIQQLAAVLAAQLLLALAIGLAWRPMAATIVVAQRPSFPLFEPETTLDVRFGEAVVLSGYTLRQNGARLDLTLFWEAEERVERPYTVFNHIVDAQGKLIAQGDGWSADGQWPSSCWAPGERVVDSFTLTLPEDLASGPYTLRTGLYDARDGRRLPRANGTDYLTLQTIQYGHSHE